MHLDLLLLQIGAILLLSRVLARVLRRLGQPSVIAEIVAGIALGPSVLGALWPAGLAALFPVASLGGLSLVAQLGLVFFMFLVGLEFDPRLVQDQGRASVAISTVGIVAPFALGVAVAWPLHAELAPGGVSLLSFALFLGTAMSITAFPVLARILAERRLIRTRVGALALASAAVGDVTAWCLLALVVGVASARGVGAAIWTTGLTLTYSLAVWMLARPVLARIGPRAGQVVSTEVIAVVFLLVLVSASITEWIGIHALFGSFLVGAAMPRRGGLSTVLTEKMEDFVTVVLLPLFFAYSGLRTEIGLLSSPRDWALCALIVAVASVGKFGGTALVARWMGMSACDSSALGVLMNTRGLMELVVLNVGLDMGVISPRLFAMMVIMALVTTWITSPILRRLYPDGLAPAPAPCAEPALLVCVADPGSADPLVQVASAWSRGREAPVLALHLRPTERPHDYLREAAGQEEPLRAVARSAARTGLRYEPLSFPSAEPAEDIARAASQRATALVLIGAHRSTLGWDTLGGVTGRVLRDCPSEVAVLVAHDLDAPRRICVQSGSGPHADAARRVAERLAKGAGAALVETEEGADLLVAPWTPDTSGPAAGGVATLLVRAVLAG